MGQEFQKVVINNGLNEINHTVYIFDYKKEDSKHKLSHMFDSLKTIKGIINFKPTWNDYEENDNNKGKATIVYDFTEKTTLSQVRLWNNDDSFGIKNIKVKYWDDSKNDWVKITWRGGTGYHDDSWLYDDDNIIKFVDASARYWMFVLYPKDSEKNGVGLGELELWGPPEP